MLYKKGEYKMDDNSYKELQKKYNLASSLKFDIAETDKEIINLNNIDETELKSIYFRALSGYILDEQEWIVQKFLFKKIIDFALQYRKNKLKILQKQFKELI